MKLKTYDIILNRLASKEIKKIIGKIFVREYRFHPTRRWKFDFAYPDYKLAIEAEGGTWVQGRHTRGIGYSNDCEKYNEAQLLGWVVLRYTDLNVDQLKNDLLNFGIRLLKN